MVEGFMFTKPMLSKFILKKIFFIDWHNHFIEHDNTSLNEIFSIFSCVPYDCLIHEMIGKCLYRNSYHYFKECEIIC